MNEIESKDQWFNLRWGKFTASEIYKLFTPPKKKDSGMFGQTAMGYIQSRAVERMTNIFERPELEEVKSLLHGRVHEQPAYERYIRETKLTSMRYFGTDDPVFIEYGDNAGGSPDGLMGEGTTIHIGLELKNPRNPSIHFDHLQLKDAEALKEYSINYYAQCQFNMLITNASFWHFVSHDERFRSDSQKLKIIELEPDKPFLAELRVRLAQAEFECQKLITV